MAKKTAKSSGNKPKFVTPSELRAYAGKIRKAVAKVTVDAFKKAKDIQSVAKFESHKLAHDAREFIGRFSSDSFNSEFGRRMCLLLVAKLGDVMSSVASSMKNKDSSSRRLQKGYNASKSMCLAVAELLETVADNLEIADKRHDQRKKDLKSGKIDESAWKKLDKDWAVNGEAWKKFQEKNKVSF